MVEVPHRRFETKISVSGDTWDDVLRELERLVDHVRDHGPECSLTGGGGSAGSYIHTVEDSTMTPERFRAELSVWAAARRAERKAEQP